MIRSNQLSAATLDAASSQASFRPGAAIGKKILSQVLRLLGSWQHRGRSRRDLLELDDHLLKDIGLTRWQVEDESSKPFWRV